MIPFIAINFAPLARAGGRFLLIFSFFELTLEPFNLLTKRLKINSDNPSSNKTANLSPFFTIRKEKSFSCVVKTSNLFMKNHSKSPKIITPAAIGLIGLVLLISYLFLSQGGANNHLYLNEISFTDNGKQDWIEIYNPTMNNLSLEGLYLSDDANDFSKFHLKTKIIVPSHGYAVIYGDGYENVDESLIANFRVSSGETIYLIAGDGSSIIDSFMVIDSERDMTDLTLGRDGDGGENIGIMPASPGSANQELIE